MSLAIKEQLDTYYEGYKAFRTSIAFLEALDIILITLASTTGVVIVLLYYFRVKKKYIKQNKKLIQFKINSFLSDLVFSEDQEETDLDLKISEFKRKIPIAKTWCKELMIQNIIDLDKNFKGDFTEKLVAIYFKMGLHDYCTGLINSRIWYAKTKAIYFWRELKYTAGAKKIYPYIFSDNPELRSSALLAYITLEENDPLAVIEKYSEHISLVEALNILNVIQRRKIKKPKNLSEWLKFRQSSKVIFALRLVAYYNDLESSGAVFHLLTSKNPKVRNEAIVTVGKLYMSEAEHMLISMYPNEIQVNQITILKTLSQIGSDFTIDFVKQLLRKKQGSEVVLTAMKVLKEIDPQFEYEQFDFDPYLTLAKNHIQEPVSSDDILI